VEIEPKRQYADSISKQITGRAKITALNTNQQMISPLITVPESSYVEIVAETTYPATYTDVIIRSPFYQTIIPLASRYGGSWISPIFTTETILDIGIYWRWYEQSGYEYGVQAYQIDERKYVLYFEDIGDICGEECKDYIDYDDLIVYVTINDPPDHFIVTVTPDTMVYGDVYRNWADVYATAVDKEGREVPYHGSTAIMLSMVPSTYCSIYGFSGEVSSVTYDKLRRGWIYLRADRLNPKQPQEVEITVTDGVISGKGKAVVQGGACPVIQLSENRISPGEKVTISLMERRIDNTLVPYPEDQLFLIWINTEGEYGSLRCVPTGETSSRELYEMPQPFEFTAAEEIEADSVVVEIEAWPIEGYSGGGGATSIVTNPMRDGTNNLQDANAGMNNWKQKIMERIGRRGIIKDIDKSEAKIQSAISIANNTIQQTNILTETCSECIDCAPKGWITIVKEDECVAVTPEQDTLSIGEQTRLTFDHGSRFDVFLLGSEGETGTLVAGEQTGTELYDVTEPVYYIAPDSISEDIITVQFWARIHKAGSGGAGANAQVKPVEDTSIVAKTKLQNETIHENKSILKQMQQNSCAVSSATVKGPILKIHKLPDEEKVQKIKGTNPPEMPKPPVKVQLQNYKGGKVNFYWDIWIEWDGRGNWHTPRNPEIYQGTAEANNDEIKELEIDLSSFIRGGQTIKLQLKAVAGGKTYTSKEENLFIIKGLNPSKELMLSTLGDLKYKVIAYKESRFNQFAPNANTECVSEPNYPLQGGTNPDDIGIMQINNPKNDDIIWNWVANINEGKRLLDWNLWYVENMFAKEQYEKHPDARALTYLEKLEMAYALYNNYRETHKNYWEWKVVKKEDDKEIYNWVRNKPLNNPNYAEELIKLYNNPQSGW